MDLLVRLTRAVRTVVTIAIVLSAARLAMSDDTAQELVARLPTSAEVWTSDDPIQKRLVALGGGALDALEEGLLLDLHGEALRQHMDSHGSRRAAVVTVLAEIPGRRSTDLLVRSLAEEPDNYSMRGGARLALEKRRLSTEQLVSLLRNFRPDAVLLALRRIDVVASGGPLQDAVTAVYDGERARRQFTNEFGVSTASDDDLWEVRLAAGHALRIDMTPEMRTRAAAIVGSLREVVARKAGPDDTANFPGGSRRESQLHQSIGRLAVLGSVAHEVVAGAAERADGDLRSVLDVALFAMGDPKRLGSVTTTLIENADPHLRICAASVLYRTKDVRAVPALWKALEDPYHRSRLDCVGPRRDEYPVRELAQETLISLGQPEGVVRAKARSAAFPWMLVEWLLPAGVLAFLVVRTARNRRRKPR